MKRLALLFVGIMLFPFFSNAGGIVTNTNQSASWVRMFARDASTSIDAVYFNPAGLAKLGDGLYLSLNDQILTQNRYISSDYQYLNTSDFEGSVFAPIFPSIYAAYKKGKFAISLGVNVIGGGGSATFENGFPLFETGISDLVPALASQGVTGYNLDAYLEGSSVFWGYQLGITYAINDMISIYAGARYVSAKNTYVGHLKDINLEMGATEVPASAFFTTSAASATSTATTLQSIINANAAYGNLTLAQAEAFTIINSAQRAALAAGYTAIGLDPATATISQGQVGFTTMAQTATAKSKLLADQKADVEQTGSGIAPIFGVNLSLMENKLNIGMKYEFETNIKMKNNTAKDFLTGFTSTGDSITMFPDGTEFNSDMPAMFAIGADYKVTDKFSIALGGHFYFDKQANYGKKIAGVYVDNDQVINKGLWEFALGLEYKLSEKFLVSLGYLHTQIGVKEIYQSDLSFTNSSNSFGFGAAYKVTPAIELNLGFGYTSYNTFDKNQSHDFGGQGTTFIDEVVSYDKDNILIAIGLDFKLFGNK